MASLIEELIDTLQQEYEIYKKLIPIAENKTEVIVSNDLITLQDITEREQAMIEAINALERKRDEVVINIGTVVNKDPGTIHIRTVIQILEKQPKEQKQLSEIHDNLKNTIQRLVEINNHNKSLIQQSLEMIEFNMNFIQSTRMSPGNLSYNKGASQFDMPSLQTGMFDAKQ
ncbi:flagellar protein FlgN [Anaerocolumna sp. AGMB13025]|uniref:flagellar protein FlgN n=1 Tax=Anaerocolumna sp. AGMB13025 TaxID=3039116 RepID=UPI00241E1A78|nr:flagellar protein FlgN [Anaerocolumna sp. AGMB13025]WFR56811.1 flagellar protein FlgN [Anaerocolumna sp. AGMB13025]